MAKETFVSKEKNASKLDVALKLGLVLFISLLSFAVGTFVGKKFSDNQHQVAKYEHGSQKQGTSEEASRGVASADPHANTLKDKEALSDDEIAKLAEEFVAEESLKKEDEGHGADSSGRSTASVTEKTEAEPSHAEASHSPASTKDKKEVTATDASSSEKKVETSKVMDHNSLPSADSKAKAAAKVETKLDAKDELKAEKKAKPELPSTNLGKYTVQIASYSSENDAQKMSSGLKEKGIPAFYISAKVKDQTWYRVSVGLFDSSDDAEAHKKKLDKDGISKTIVQKIQ